MHLLLVEDDDGMAFLMRRSLERAGHHVITCATAAAGLLAVRQGKFDLISLNQVLPDGYGLELLQDLRQEGVQTPAIMVTGRDDPFLISQALRAGALDFVVKDRNLAFLAELPERVARAARAGDLDRGADTVVIQPPTLPALRMNASDPDCATDPEASDPLTGLPGRAALRTLLKDSCDAARRSGQLVSLLALDLDHFRQLNDKYLLPGGDKLLVAVVRLLSSLARPGQRLFRDGGDQFTFVLPGAGAEEAFREAERFRIAAASTPLEVQIGGRVEAVAVTVSVGVATLVPSDIDAWLLFLRAREAVHQAKDAGRNRVFAPECDGAQHLDRDADTVVIQSPTPPASLGLQMIQPQYPPAPRTIWPLLNVDFLFSFVRRWNARRLVAARSRHYRDVMDQVHDDR